MFDEEPTHDAASSGDAGEELSLVAALGEGLKQADEGKVRSHEEVKEFLARWTSR